MWESEISASEESDALQVYSLYVVHVLALTVQTLGLIVFLLKTKNIMTNSKRLV